MFSGQRSPGPNASARVENQTDYEDASKDATGLLAEELRRKDAHIARLEAMLRQAGEMPTEHERRPEAFLPTDAPERTADPSGTLSAPQNGAMVYDAPPVAPKAASAGSANRVGGAMVYEMPSVTSPAARIRLEDMNLETSPIAQIVMQAAARRWAEPVIAFEPTLRLPAQAAGQPASLRNVANNHARPRQIAVVGALGLLAFAGVIGASQLRAPQDQPVLIAPPPAIARAAFAGLPVKVSRTDPASAPTTIEPDSSPIEILPAAPAPRTIRRAARHMSNAPIAAAAPPSLDPEPLPRPAHAVHIRQYPAHAVHTMQPSVATATPIANSRKSATPALQSETSGVVVEAGGERPGALAPVSHSDTPFRSDASGPMDGGAAQASSRGTEVLPDDTQDMYGDRRASGYRARRRRGYRYSQPEASERRRNAYKYGESANRRSGDDTDAARHSIHGYDERDDARTDDLSDR